jgi:hypothetical protein
MPGYKKSSKSKSSKKSRKSQGKTSPPLDSRGEPLRRGPIGGTAGHYELKPDYELGAQKGYESGKGFLPDCEEVLYFAEQIDPRFENIAVRTTITTLNELRERFETEMPKRVGPLNRKDEAQRQALECMMTDIKKNVRRYSTAQIKAMAVDSKAWEDWCNDVIIYASMDSILNGTDLAIMPTDIVKGWGEISKGIDRDHRKKK